MHHPPRREPLPSTRHVYWRVDPDMSDEELDAWAEQFVDAVLTDEAKRRR
jgi:hypothetical protein